MKKGNATILASILAIALVAAGVGAGTMAQFFSILPGTGSFTTGTLTLGPLGAADYYGWTPSNLQPGDTWTTDIVLTNTGTLGAKYVYEAFYITSDTGPGRGLADKIVLVQIYDWCTTEGGATETGYSNAAWCNTGLTYWGAPVGDLDGSISLWDLAYVAMPGGTSATTSLKQLTVDPNGFYLPAGAQCRIDFTFKLLDNTGNAYQGRTCGFRIVFIATNASGSDVDTLS